MSGAISLQMTGRFGNQLFQYAFGRAYAERFNARLHTPKWLGQTIFEIDDPLPSDQSLPIRAECESDRWMGQTNIEIRGYCMRQQSLIYTRRDAKQWFRFRPEIAQALGNVPCFHYCAHLRHGDFCGTPAFIPISKEAFLSTCDRFGIPKEQLHFVSEQTAFHVPELVVLDIGFLPDFWTLIHAKVLLRANSSFSWWAATLGGAHRIFAPTLAGIAGSATPVDVPFVEGNWPSLSPNHAFCSDLHLSE